MIDSDNKMTAAAVAVLATRAKTKASKIKRNNGKYGINQLEAFKVYAHVQGY